MPYCEPLLSLNGRLGPKETKQRKLFLLIMCFLAFFTTLIIVTTVHLGHTLFIIGCSCIAVTSYGGIAAMLCGAPLSQRMICTCTGMLAMGLVLGDLWSISNLHTTGAAFVVVIDFLLVLRADDRFTAVMVTLILLWIVVTQVELALRFGLMDLPGTSSYEHRRELFIGQADCAKPPCAHSPQLIISNVSYAAGLVLIDFVATRGFAREVLKEQAAMERTINAVQKIASLLAGYDVEGVARMLKDQETLLPEEMHATLQTLEENLRRYRPYLPAALFEEMETEEREKVQFTSALPPGLDNERATIVFTDIRASTSIWEYAPVGMRAALNVHNAVMREVMGEFGGYEVKTIGDAFMIAFSSTTDGVNFGLCVHERLRTADWPASLLEEVPICAEQGSLWGGLTVRIGVNTGPVTVEQNTLTGRTDYFGHTVNVASRLESTCKPGAVAVLSDLWAAECRSCACVVADAVTVDLKGVADKMSVRCAWPCSLAGRKRNPLESDVVRTSTLRLSACSDGSSKLAASTHPQFPATTAKQLCGTIGMIDLDVGDEALLSSLRNMSAGLAVLTVSLDQSGGTVVSLLGSHVCVGWNLSRAAPAHMENAIRFAQRLLGASLVVGAGFASGNVQHGDVGARTQLFVTVMGHTVRRSRALCEKACRGVALYEPSHAVLLPSTLEGALTAHCIEGVYEVMCIAR